MAQKRYSTPFVARDKKVPLPPLLLLLAQLEFWNILCDKKVLRVLLLSRCHHCADMNGFCVSWVLVVRCHSAGRSWEWSRVGKKVRHVKRPCTINFVANNFRLCFLLLVQLEWWNIFCDKNVLRVLLSVIVVPTWIYFVWLLVEPKRKGNVLSSCRQKFGVVPSW